MHIRVRRLRVPCLDPRAQGPGRQATTKPVLAGHHYMVPKGAMAAKSMTPVQSRPKGIAPSWSQEALCFLVGFPLAILVVVDCSPASRLAFSRWVRWLH